MGRGQEQGLPLEIINNYRLSLLFLFGSYADESNNHNSDLDLGYLSKELLDKKRELELLEDLIEFYQKGEIDLVDLRKASPALKLEIALKGKPIYGSPEELLEFQLYAARRYADSKLFQGFFHDLS